MSLIDIKSSFVKNKIQILEIDASTTILASDNAICNFEIGSALHDINPFFYSLELLLDDNFEGVKYPCVNINSNTSNYIFDIDVLKKGDSIYVILVDFTEHYTDSHPLVQEKNEAQIEKSRLSFESELLYAKESFKNTFLSHLNHEIRNPLNNLLGFVDVLMETNLNFQQKEYLNVINKTGLHIKVLMDGLLDISKIESGTLELKHIPFNLIQSIVNISKHFQTKCNNTDVTLSYELGKNIPQKLIGDPTRLNQILYNLLDNATQNTTKGAIEIKVTLKSIENEKAMIRFEISDTGVGMAKNEIKNFFETYSQLQLSKIKPLGQGQGLGLKIVKDLSEKMGGTVTVDSDENKGSVFTVMLPFDTRKHTTKKKTVPKGSGIFLSKKVLVIEENQTSQMLLMKQFIDNDLGYILELAKNGQHALEIINSKKYSAIILKTNLEDMTAQTFINKIRNYEEITIKNTPIIIATGNSMIDEKQQMIDIGANEFLSKPYSKKDLFKILKQY